MSSTDQSLRVTLEALEAHLPDQERDVLVAAACDARAAISALLRKRVDNVTQICLRRGHRGSKAATRTVAARPCPACGASAEGIATAARIVDPDHA